MRDDFSEGASKLSPSMVGSSNKVGIHFVYKREVQRPSGEFSFLFPFHPFAISQDSFLLQTVCLTSQSLLHSTRYSSLISCPCSLAINPSSVLILSAQTATYHFVVHHLSIWRTNISKFTINPLPLQFHQNLNMLHTILSKLKGTRFRLPSLLNQ